MSTKKKTVKQYLRSKGLHKDGIIKQIISAYKHNYSKIDLIKAGFNRNTVYRQTREYDMSNGVEA